MSKIFNDIPMERAEVLFNNDLDASALKLFYDNCIRMGSGDNLNVTTATIHPVIWFSDFLPLFQEKIRWTNFNDSCRGNLRRYCENVYLYFITYYLIIYF